MWSWLTWKLLSRRHVLRVIRLPVSWVLALKVCSTIPRLTKNVYIFWDRFFSCCSPCWARTLYQDDLELLIHLCLLLLAGIACVSPHPVSTLLFETRSLYAALADLNRLDQASLKFIGRYLLLPPRSWEMLNTTLVCFFFKLCVCLCVSVCQYVQVNAATQRGQERASDSLVLEQMSSYESVLWPFWNRYPIYSHFVFISILPVCMSPWGCQIP